MKGDKNQHSSFHKWLSETKCLVSTLVVLFIFTADVASLIVCSAGYSPLTIDCTYIQAEGILCTWKWKNLSTVSHQGGQNMTATIVLNNSIGIPSQSCIGQEANTTCRFRNDFHASDVFTVSAIVNNERDAEVYEACKKYSLLSTVRYEKPRNVTFYHFIYYGSWVTDVVWQFPSDYPSSQGVMKTWSFCKVRWSENLGPWESREISSRSYCSLDNINSLSTYNVQVTCMSRYSEKENWTPNHTFTTQPAQTDGINQDSPSYVTSTRTTGTSFQVMPKVTRPSSQGQTSEQSAIALSTRKSDTTKNIPTTTNNVTVAVMLKGSGASLALGVIGAIVLLSAILIGGFILTNRYRKILEKGNSPSRLEDDLNEQAEDITRWKSKEKLLDNALFGNCSRNPKESAL